ncbi:MAG: hypothetical protein GY820_36660 [Gammaproteobacteria bacterium]|nr:hypothetical protein [Gammaproteobacteria bacterium]
MAASGRKKNAVIAELYNAQLAPHIYCGPVAHAAAAQLAFSCPNFLIVETIQTDLHDIILQKPLAWEAGYMPAPNEPGLGIELNEKVIEAHPYSSGGRLHLEMCQKVLDSNNQNTIDAASDAY